MLVTLLTFQLERSLLNFTASQNIEFISVTLSVFQFPIDWLKLVAHRNIQAIFVTLLVSWSRGKIISDLKSLKKREASSGNCTPDLNSILLRAVCSKPKVTFSWIHVLRSIFPVPAQRGWMVKVCAPWSHTPSTFVPRLKVWLGTFTCAKTNPLNIKIDKKEKINLESIFILQH